MLSLSLLASKAIMVICSTLLVWKGERGGHPQVFPSLNQYHKTCPLFPLNFQLPTKVHWVGLQMVSLFDITASAILVGTYLLGEHIATQVLLIAVHTHFYDPASLPLES